MPIDIVKFLREGHYITPVLVTGNSRDQFRFEFNDAGVLVMSVTLDGRWLGELLLSPATVRELSTVFAAAVDVIDDNEGGRNAEETRG